MPTIDGWTLLVFPALLGAALLALRRAYRGVADVNRVFRVGWRAPALAPALAVVTAVAAALFAAVQLVRVPFLVRAVDASFAGAPPTPATAALGALLVVGLAAELVAFTHLLLYLRLCRGSARPAPATAVRVAATAAPGRVAALVPACDEPLEVLERSLGSLGRLAHRPLDVLLVENSRDPRRKAAALALAQRLDVEALDLKNRGTKAAALNDARLHLHPATRHVLVLDADQELREDLLAEALPVLEADPGLAFVQTAQAYEDAGASLLAAAAAQQQMLLYDCVLESRSRDGRAPCVGTNLVMRLEALDAAGGWDEENVTEDLATSHRLHALGWRSLYLRRICAVGLAPPDRAAYYRQQRRWAWGNTALVLRLLRGLVRRRGRSGSLGLEVEYLWSAGFYLNTVFLGILGLTPTVALVAGTLAAPEVPLAAELPVPPTLFVSLYLLYVLVLCFPLLNMSLRGYPLRNLLLVQGLTTSTGPVYVRGVMAALRGQPPLFDPVRGAPPTAWQPPSRWRAPQTLAFAVFAVTGSVLTALALAYPTHPIPWVLAFWCFVHGLFAGHYFLLGETPE